MCNTAVNDTVYWENLASINFGESLTKTYWQILNLVRQTHAHCAIMRHGNIGEVWIWRFPANFQITQLKPLPNFPLYGIHVHINMDILTPKKTLLEYLTNFWNILSTEPWHELITYYFFNIMFIVCALVFEQKNLFRIPLSIELLAWVNNL